MLLDLRAVDKLRGDGAAVESVLASIQHAVDDTSVDLSKLRLVFDWIQYRHCFRDPVEIRPILNGRASERLEIGVDLRRSRTSDIHAEVTRALARREGSNRLYLEPWSRTTTSLIWNFNALYWQ